MRQALFFSISCFLALCPLIACGQQPVNLATANIPKAKINYDALEKLNVRIGVQSYTFRANTVFDTIEIAHKMGLKYIEIWPGQRLAAATGNQKSDPTMTPAQLDSLIKHLKDNEMKVVSMGVYNPQDVDTEVAFRKVFEFAKKLGAENIVAEPTPNKTVFDMIEKLVGEYKINVCMHNHPQATSIYRYPEKVLEMTKDRPNTIGSCSDTGHWARSALVPVDCLKKLEGRIIELHLKDITAALQDTPWGTGVVDAKGIMAELKRQGPKNQVFFIEYESTAGQVLVDNVIKCCENFSNYAEELTKDAK